MTNKDLPCEATQQEPFQVVLIDLQKAAKYRLQCVKKPLTDDLKFVAISYRWGELQETSMNTQVGYLASITSFALDDFYRLCEAIRNEPTMASMDYVWVDAICVNQSNHNERKETIYHMTEIYEQASWILAVPDLHEAHLKTMHRNVMASIQQHKRYLYYLLHGDLETLCQMDTTFLDDSGVPNDHNLRQLLVKHTHCFADGFMHYQHDSYHQEDIRLLSHLYDLHVDHHAKAPPLEMKPNPFLRVREDIRTMHQCNQVYCPFLYDYTEPFQSHHEWHKKVIERSNAIHQAIYFWTDLIVDWSSRVWVISEFHISKKKNNLKFWFNQLDGGVFDTMFFKFDLGDPRFKRIRSTNVHMDPFASTPNPVYAAFYQQLIHQLDRQTFLEMMLKSKVSKNGPLLCYLSLLSEIQAFAPKQWVTNVHSIPAVKLKLYQVMSPEDKLLLLDLSARGKPSLALPTFATSFIDWPRSLIGDRLVSTANATQVDITLLCSETLGYYLRVKPTKYAVLREVCCRDADASKTLNQLLHPKTLPQVDYDWLSRYDDDLPTVVDVLVLFEDMRISFFGSFDENIWVIHNSYFTNDFDIVENLADDFPGFRVY